MAVGYWFKVDFKLDKVRNTNQNSGGTGFGGK